jgi:hypothetical protein
MGALRDVSSEEALVIRYAWLAVVMLMAGGGRVMAQDYDRGWIDVNFGTAAAAEYAYTAVRVLTIAGEAGGGAAAYSIPRGGSFDVGGGYMFNRWIGAGVSLAGASHEDIAGLAISVPHPLYYDASATDATTTSGMLGRSEGVWHVQAMVVPVQTPRFRLRAFGGPSYFRVEQDVISSIDYDHVFQIFGRGNVVDISSYDTRTSIGTGWGFHAGGDASFFFNRVFGVGAMVRVSRATLEIDDYGGPEDRKAGGVQFGGGLRLKF